MVNIISCLRRWLAYRRYILTYTGDQFDFGSENTYSSRIIAAAEVVVETETKTCALCVSGHSETLCTGPSRDGLKRPLQSEAYSSSLSSSKSLGYPSSRACLT